MDVSRRRVIRLLLRGVPLGFVAACTSRGPIVGDAPRSSAVPSRPGELLPASTVPPIARTTTTSTAISPLVLTVIGRDGWDAEPTAPDPRRHRIERATVHHSAVAAGPDVDMAARLRSHQAYHRSLGWPDIAYHLIVDPRGRIWEGRPLRMPGDTATSYDPTGHLLVCLEGDHDLDPPSTEALTALGLVLAWGRRRYGLADDVVAGHRAYASTSCPGDRLASALPSVVAASEVHAGRRIGMRVLRGAAARTAART